MNIVSPDLVATFPGIDRRFHQSIDGPVHVEADQMKTMKGLAPIEEVLFLEAQCMKIGLGEFNFAGLQLNGWLTPWFRLEEVPDQPLMRRIIFTPFEKQPAQ